MANDLVLVTGAAEAYISGNELLLILKSRLRELLQLNHSIRRADLDRRVVETVFPAMADGKKYKSFWKWILDNVWPGKLKSEAFNFESFLFPWHMLKASDSNH